MALGQTCTKAHSNEITALPELLKALELKGCLVTIDATIDAMGCQKNIAQQVVQRGQACFFLLRHQPVHYQEKLRHNVLHPHSGTQ